MKGGSKLDALKLGKNMTDGQRGRHSIEVIKQNLRRLEQQIRGPYARPADFVTRDRLARRLQEALEVR